MRAILLGSTGKPSAPGEEEDFFLLPGTVEEAAEKMAVRWKDGHAKGLLPIGAPKTPESDVVSDLVSEILFISSMGSNHKMNLADQNCRNRIRRIAPFLSRWGSIGTPQFQVTASAEAAWILTDCSSLLWSDVLLPFDAFLIRLPSPGAIKVPMNDGSFAEATTVIVRRTKGFVQGHVGADDVILRFEQGLASLNEQSARTRLWSYEAILGDMQPCSILDVMILGRHPSLKSEIETSVATMRWIERPEQKLEEWFDTIEKSVVSEGQAALRAVMSVITGLCLYLDGLSRKGKWSKTPKSTKGSKGPVRLRWCSGSEIKLPREVRDAAAAFVARKHQPMQWKLVGRKLIRGHRQRYYYGTGENKVPDWKEKLPYWQGEEAAKVAASLYKTPDGGFRKDTP